MNVLFLSQIVPYPPHGGVLQRGYNILRELGRHADVHLLAFLHPDELRTPEAVAESRHALEQFCRTVEYFPLWAKASRLHRLAALGLSAVSPEPFSMIAHRSGAFAARVAHHLASSRIDLVHVDTIGLDPFMRPHRQWASVLTHHNIESQLMARRAGVEASLPARLFLQREAAKLRRHEARVTAAYDMNVVVSDVDGRTLRDIAPGLPTAVVPNGVDTSYFTPDDGAGEQPAMIYTGGMNMFANRDAVLHFARDIWPRVKAARPDARFISVGQDPPEELRALAERDPGIEVKGFVDDIRPYVRRAAVYVVPLRVGGGTRLKVLDAMAMGKAMVSTAVGCEGIQARDGEHLLMADEPSAFAAAVLSLLDDAWRRRALGRRARALVDEQYAWPHIGGRLLGAYADAQAMARQRRAGAGTR